MDRIREFLVNAFVAIKENAKGVIQQFPYTVGAVYLLGMMTVLLAQWLF